tara:strand:- start:265 stop:2391 length:2127 start_codon:yes stop_codon:yes gene_type:complete
MAEEQTNTVDEVGGEAPVVAASEPPVETAPPLDTAPTPAAEVSPEFMSFMLPGFPRPIELPSNLSDADRAKAINAYLQSDAAKEFIDQDSGAPAFVREQVGNAPTEDRLANIRRFYPDAAPYDDDNFIYTNPDTGRLTLYNDRGLSVGDVASLTREAFVATGGTFGAILGVPAGPPGIAVGAGSGATVAGELYDTYSNVFLNRVDTRSVLDRSVDAGTEFFLSAVGQRGGELLTEGTKRVLGGGTQKAKQLAAKFRSLRIDPPAGAVSSSITVATLEQALGASPFSSDVVQKQATRVLEQITQAAKNTVAKIGTPVSKAEAGSVIRTAASNAAGRFKATQNAAYEKAFDLIGKDAPVALDAVRALRESLENQLNEAPGSLQRSLGQAINTLKTIEMDATESAVSGTIPFSALRQIRTAIGKDLDEPLLAGSTGSQNAAMRQVYGALTEDMSAVAKLAGPEARKALEVADRYTRAWMNTAGVTLNKIGKFDTDEQAYNFAMSRLGDGGTNLQRLRNQFEPEEWDTVAASVLEKIGLARPGAQDATGEVFSVNTFFTNWSKMSAEAKNALFGGKRYAEMREGLDTLVDVASSLKGVEKLANTSNTGRVLITYLTLTGAGTGLAEMGTGQGAGALSAFLVGGLGSRYSAKLITSPKFINWLTTPVTNPNGIGPHFGRLTAIAAEDPALKEPIAAFLRTFEGAPQPQGVEKE